MKIPQGDEDQFKAAANPEVSIERIDLDILMICRYDGDLLTQRLDQKTIVADLRWRVLIQVFIGPS